MQVKASIKHLQIDKANSRMFIVVAIASVVTVFSLMSAKALLAQSSYQRNVLTERNKAIEQLKANVSAVEKLKTQYDVFVKADPNIIGGKGGTNPGDGPKDGDNSQIVLDALPNQYDFPALISSMEKIAKNSNITLKGLSGTDEGKDSGVQEESSEPIIMTFSVSTETDYKNSLSLVRDFERSIRPIDITSFSLTGSSTKITTNIQASTYYKPSIGLKIEQKEVK